MLHHENLWQGQCEYSKDYNDFRVGEISMHNAVHSEAMRILTVCWANITVLHVAIEWDNVLHM